MNIIKNIGVLGDSILKGVVVDELSGRYKFLKENAAHLFGKTNQVMVSNFSKFGCTTKKALKQLPSVLAKDTASEIFLLELGGNDCDYDWDAVCEHPDGRHFPNVSLREFKKNIAAIVDALLAAGKRPVVMTLPPIDSERYFNWIVGQNKTRKDNLLRFLGDKNYIYRHQELYASALEKIARKYKLYTVQVRDRLLAVPKYSDYLCADGIHLNELGQKLLKKIFDLTYRQYLLGL